MVSTGAESGPVVSVVGGVDWSCVGGVAWLLVGAGGVACPSVLAWPTTDIRPPAKDPADGLNDGLAVLFAGAAGPGDVVQPVPAGGSTGALAAAAKLPSG